MWYLGRNNLCWIFFVQWLTIGKWKLPQLSCTIYLRDLAPVLWLLKHRADTPKLKITSALLVQRNPCTATHGWLYPSPRQTCGTHISPHLVACILSSISICGSDLSVSRAHNVKTQRRRQRSDSRSCEDRAGYPLISKTVQSTQGLLALPCLTYMSPHSGHRLFVSWPAKENRFPLLSCLRRAKCTKSPSKNLWGPEFLWVILFTCSR